MDEGFFQVHRNLPREGPGLPEDVIWALDVAGTPQNARICDAACGPGGDTLTLVEVCPDAEVMGIEMTPHFVDEARARCPDARFELGDMARIEGPFDLIWCAGAVYFLGVTEALTLWRKAIAAGGKVAFSEPVLIGDRQSEECMKFWEEYPGIKPFSGIEVQVSAAGYSVIDHRILTDEPWKAYYDPMQARIDDLRKTAGPDLIPALDEAQMEIDLWRAVPDEIAYALLVVEPE